MGFQPPNVGAGANGASPFLMGLLSAIASLPAQNAARKQQQAQTGLTQAEIAAYKANADPNSPDNVAKKLANTQLQDQLTQTQQANAQAQFKTLYGQVLTNPALATVYKSKLDELAQASGMPTNPAYNPDGSFNSDFGLTPLNQLPFNAQTDAFRNELVAKNPGQDRVTYARSFGVAIPKDDPILTAAPTYTVKASNDLLKTAQQGVHYANQDQTAAARADALRVINKARADEAEGRASLETVQAQNYVRIQNAKLADAQTNATAHATEAQAALLRAQNAGKALGGGNQRLAQKFYSEGMDAVARAQRAKAGFDAAVAEAQAAGADDTTLQPLLQKQAQATAQLQTATDQLSLISTELGANTGHAANVQGASGARRVTVTDLGRPPASGGGNFTVGTIYTDAKGNKARYNGPNSWTPVP